MRPAVRVPDHARAGAGPPTTSIGRRARSGTTIAGLDNEAERADLLAMQRTFMDVGNLAGVVVAGFALAAGAGAAIGLAGGALVLGVVVVLGCWMRSDRARAYSAAASSAASPSRSIRSGGRTVAPSRT